MLYVTVKFGLWKQNNKLITNYHICHVPKSVLLLKVYWAKYRVAQKCFSLVVCKVVLYNIVWSRVLTASGCVNKFTRLRTSFFEGLCKLNLLNRLIHKSCPTHSPVQAVVPFRPSWGFAASCRPWGHCRGRRRGPRRAGRPGVGCRWWGAVGAGWSRPVGPSFRAVKTIIRGDVKTIIRI